MNELDAEEIIAKMEEKMLLMGDFTQELVDFVRSEYPSEKDWPESFFVLPAAPLKSWLARAKEQYDNLR